MIHNRFLCQLHFLSWIICISVSFPGSMLMGLLLHCLADQMYEYTRPILLLHFPLYRRNELDCAVDDAWDTMPYRDREVAYQPKLDCLSKSATDEVTSLRVPLLCRCHFDDIFESIFHKLNQFLPLQLLHPIWIAVTDLSFGPAYLKSSSYVHGVTNLVILFFTIMIMLKMRTP